MGSSDLGQRARLETAEVCSRGQRGRFNSGGPRPLVKQRNAVWSCVQVRKGGEADRRKEKREEH